MAQALCQRGAGSAVVSSGKDGVAFATADACIELPAVAAEVVDVTGAGDALVAGTLYGRLTGCSPTRSLEIGLNAAAIAIAAGDRETMEWSAGSITRAVERE
jgi:pseudouridine kinase